MRALTIILQLLLIAGFAYSQTDCKPYVPTTKGTQWEITNYSPKGKETGKISYELVEKVVSDNEIIFTIKNTTYDDKGEQVYSNTFDAKCVDGKFEFDMAYKMDGGSMEAYESMDVEIDATNFEIPTMDVLAGTRLEDGSLTIGIGSEGMTVMRMTILVTDRIVEAKEKITTPAGEFECIVLSQNVSTKMIMKVNASSKEWYAEEIGMVRSESYNKKGKLTGYSELTKLKME